MHAQLLSRARLSETSWTTAHQAPLYMGFSRQESWSGLPCPPPGDLPDPRTETTSPEMAGRLFFFSPHLATCEEALTRCRIIHKFLLVSKGGCFWPYSEVHHGPSDCHCKKKLDFAVGMWHPSEGISQAADERLLFM